jgi:hypothetical protein
VRAFGDLDLEEAITAIGAYTVAEDGGRALTDAALNLVL